MANRLVINKGYDNEFIITIKQNGSLLPMTIVATDTFSCKLQNLSDGAVVATPTTSIYSMPNGKIKVVITSAMTTSLVRGVSDKSDGYFGLSNYRLVIQCNTANNGNFIAKMNKVCVE